MQEKLPPELAQALVSAASTFGLALIGRLVWHARMAQRSERQFFSKYLLYELIIALGIGYVAEGVVTYLGLEGKVALAGIIVLSYLGPGGLEVLIVRLATKWGRAE